MEFGRLSEVIEGKSLEFERKNVFKSPRSVLQSSQQYNIQY